MSKVVNDLLKWIEDKATKGDSSQDITIPGISFEDLTAEELDVCGKLFRLIAGRLDPERMKLLDEKRSGVSMRNISIRVDERTLDALDKLIVKGKFSSRGQGFRSAFMGLLEPALSVEVRSVRGVSVVQGLVVENSVCHDPLLVQVGTNIMMTFGDKVEEDDRKEERGFFVFDYVEAGRVIMRVYSPEVAKMSTEANAQIANLEEGGERK